MVKLKDLKGLSGCLIELMEDSDGKNYVKKTSSSIGYNDRLVLQAEKQRSFKNEHIKVPAIFDSGYNDAEHFYYLMEYIPGVTFAEYIKLYHFSKSLSIFNRLLDTITGALDGEVVDDFKKKIVGKIQELRTKNIGYDTLLEYLEQNVPGEITFAAVHGDLTFENIIITHDNQIFFIDFLDSFIDSPYIDLGKISQELTLYWSIRNIKPSTSLLIKYERLSKVFGAYCISNKINNPCFVYFSILTLLRILPYTDNQTEIELINKNIKKWEIELQ